MRPSLEMVTALPIWAQEELLRLNRQVEASERSGVALAISCLDNFAKLEPTEDGKRAILTAAASLKETSDALFR